MKASFPVMAFAAVSLFGGALVQAETAYFLMSGRFGNIGHNKPESYVLAVSDPATIKFAREYLRAPAGARDPYLIARVGIALGPDSSNRNYAEPGHPPWPWRTTRLIGLRFYNPFGLGLPVFIPNLNGSPSLVPQLLEGYSPHPPFRDPPVDWMELVHYPLVMELFPGTAAAVANVSTRGWVGSGERVLIAGFIVQGAEPRNVLVRGIGPSLAQYGVSAPLPNPKITIFRGSDKIAENDNWRAGNLSSAPDQPEDPPWFVWLFPGDPKEAAVRLSLPPGAYTVHVSGVDTATGIALVEVYDLDTLKPR